ncbi:hypothetical protein NCC49_001270 [Naganishia albida]|nr:hypothetical protein NCC49_001270 [Naganishia albida]
MDHVVQLLLIAAEALDTDDITDDNGESVTDMNTKAVQQMYPSSLAIPASLSPLYTLAALGTERIENSDVKTHGAEDTLMPVRDKSSKKSASSVWIRGGHRSTNKDALGTRTKKPYDRHPSKSTSMESVDSGGLHWYTDFPTFERQAVERKRSISSRGSILSGHASLSNMPSGLGKKVTFQNHVYAGKLASQTESASVEAKVLPRDRVETKPQMTKGRPNSSSPVKRSRGRPRKVTVRMEEHDDDYNAGIEARLKQGSSEKRVTTRSGRVVKAVQH